MSPKKPAVLITGAGTGIGEATARIFSEQGYPVIFTGRRRGVLEKAAREINTQFKTKTHVIPSDVQDPQSLLRLRDESIKVAGSVGILINNAGIYERGAFADTSDEVWESIWTTNLLGPVRLIRAFLPHFSETGGASIVNVASTAGLRPIPQLSAYVASKAALISLTQTLALELAPQKIRVNCVCPGIVETPILHMENFSPQERQKLTETYGDMHPLGRMGTPSEVAWAIYQFCVPESAWTTGSVLSVDGGIALT